MTNPAVRAAAEALHHQPDGIHFRADTPAVECVGCTANAIAALRAVANNPDVLERCSRAIDACDPLNTDEMAAAALAALTEEGGDGDNLKSEPPNSSERRLA